MKRTVLTTEQLKRAGEMLDAQPVPTKGRMYFDPKDGKVKPCCGLKNLKKVVKCLHDMA